MVTFNLVVTRLPSVINALLYPEIGLTEGLSGMCLSALHGALLTRIEGRCTGGDPEHWTTTGTSEASVMGTSKLMCTS